MDDSQEPGASAPVIEAAPAEQELWGGRIEVRGEVDGVTVVDDYAHNAGKVAAVVGTAAQIAHRRGGRLHVAFQPHLYSRTRDFADGFAAGLAPADTVSLLEDSVKRLKAQVAYIDRAYGAMGGVQSCEVSLRPFPSTDFTPQAQPSIEAALSALGQ